jgi:hypothetical protein
MVGQAGHRRSDHRTATPLERDASGQLLRDCGAPTSQSRSRQPSEKGRSRADIASSDERHDLNVGLRVDRGIGRRLLVQVLVVVAAVTGLAVVEATGNGFGFSDWPGWVVLYTFVCTSPVVACPWRVLFVVMELALAIVLTGYGGVAFLYFHIGSLLPGVAAAWTAFLVMLFWEGFATGQDG